MYTCTADVSISCAPLSDPEMPEHNLEPPRFSRRSLERLLMDWLAVKSMLMTGHKESATGGAGGGGADDVVYEDDVYLNGQHGTQRLDKFTHTLLVKCNMEVS